MYCMYVKHSFFKEAIGFALLACIVYQEHDFILFHCLLSSFGMSFMNAST